MLINMYFKNIVLITAMAYLTYFSQWMDVLNFKSPMLKAKKAGRLF